MRLFLIRHGETVDNVAGLYAGTLDSALTNHGVEQAQRLGSFLAENNIAFSHIFASPLTRAFRTADAVRNAQSALQDSNGDRGLEIVKSEELMERHYGIYEGKPYSTRSQWMRTGKGGIEETTGGVESAVSLARRCDIFLDQYLLPLFDERGSEEYIVAVVAHGMLLSHLWRRLLLRLSKNSLQVAPEITAAKGPIIPERLGGWSNTGYLELFIRRHEEPEPKPTPSTDVSPGASTPSEMSTLPTPVPPPLQSEGAEISVASPKQKEPAGKMAPKMLTGWLTTIVAIDSRKHLYGVKRQPGGIGSLANDNTQKKLDTFFKPLKLT